MDLMRIPFVLEELRALSAETEWVEFKVNNTNPEEIGEYLSALSNTAAHTKVVLFAPRPLEKMEKSERVRACYQHACLKWLAGDWMSNESLRGRLDIPKTNYPLASKIIRESIEAGLLKVADTASASLRDRRYVPFWA